MADQPARLEAATIKAEIGSGIVYRFSNDAASEADIPTPSGAIPNLKNVILRIQNEGAEKISFATKIFIDTAAGIAGTSNQEIFLVQSDEPGEIYEVWQNVSGTAVDTGKRSISAAAVIEATEAATAAAASAQESADLATARVARFLDPSAIPPIQRDDGQPLQLGDRYLNTTDQIEYIYKDFGWVANNVDGQELSSPDGATKVGAILPNGGTGTVQDAIGYLDVLIDNLALVGPTLLNLAALKAFPTNGAKWARTLGRTSQNDGGGAFWVFNSESTEVADDVAYVASSSGAGRWVLNNPGHINMRQAGCVGNGSTVDSAAMSKGHLAADKLGVRCYYPAGTYLTNQAVQAPTRGAFGDSSQSTYILCEGVPAFNFPITMSLGRAACIIERFGIIAKGETCLNTSAISIPGVASGAAHAYLSGITIRDCYIGANGNKFNIGVLAKDLFLLSVFRVNMSDVNYPFYIVGHVLQSTFRDCACYNKGTGVGFSTEQAQYAGEANPIGPEHITAADLSLISFERGISHTSGSLMITFNNMDIQAVRYGMFLRAPCIVSGGIILADPATTDWSGISIPTYSNSAGDGIVIRDIEVNGSSPTPASANLITIGDNISYVEGIVLSGLKLHSGKAKGLGNAIYGSKIGSLVIENCIIDNSAFIGDTINLTQVRKVSIRDNMASGSATISITDDGATSGGCISDNTGFAGCTFTPTSPDNWSIARTGNSPYQGQSPYGPSARLPWSPAALAAGAVGYADFNVGGATPGDAVTLGFTGQTGEFIIELSGYVKQNGVVRAIIRNSTSGALSLPSGTVVIKVFK